jgi:hypothetical protein
VISVVFGAGARGRRMRLRQLLLTRAIEASRKGERSQTRRQERVRLSSLPPSLFFSPARSLHSFTNREDHHAVSNADKNDDVGTH